MTLNRHKIYYEENKDKKKLSERLNYWKNREAITARRKQQYRDKKIIEAAIERIKRGDSPTIPNINSNYRWLG